MNEKKVIVVEDEPDICEVIVYNLKREGFRVLSSGNGREGLSLIRKEAPDLVILDLMLPDLDGLELCRKLKSDTLTANIPVMIVTAKSEESDVVLGLGLGADDYLTKPFSPKELLARVKAVMRRGPLVDQGESKERIICQGLVIDALRHQVSVDEELIEFTATEFRLLVFLASHPDRVFSRDHLIRRGVGEIVVIGDRNIDVHIRSIRKKLGPYRDFIKTIRGVGYSFRSKKDE